MKKHLTLSNFLFVIAIAFLLYTPTRVWFIRQISFAPSLEKVEKSETISNYHWELNGLNTSNMNFSELKGKVVFLNFWATWCPPCIAELPTIQNLYNDYNDRVAFVCISREKWSEINAFFEEKGYDLPSYHYKENLLTELPEINTIPRTFLIDKNGNIRIDKSGPADWNSNSLREKIDQLLKE